MKPTWRSLYGEEVKRVSLYDWMKAGGGLLLLFMTLVQITPIRINPWSVVARGIGKAMNRDILEKLDTVETDVKNLKEKHDNLEYRMDKDDAESCRTRILRFADELRRGVEHSEEFFNQILDDISQYERYCSEHPEYKNSKAVNAIAKIDKVYQDCMEKNSFL